MPAGIRGQESAFADNSMDLMNEDNPDGGRKPADEPSDVGDYDGNDFSADINNILKTILNFSAPSNEKFVLATS